jgi:microcystin-dependent protein
METYVGEVRMFSGTFAPAGWAWCDGSLYNIAEYSPLYSLINTTFGGDGNTTFGVPNLTGRVPIGAGTYLGNSTVYNVGDTGGSETVALDESHLLAHSHALAVSAAAGSTGDPTGNVLAVPPSTCTFYFEGPATAPLNAGHLLKGGGSSTPHPNVQPFLAINFIIAMNGIYPSRS